MSEHTCPGSHCGECTGLCTSRIGIFQPLTLHEQQLLVKSAKHRQVPAGFTIFSEEDPAEQIIVVHQGKIKLNHYSPEGKEYVLDIISTGDIYGEQRLFSGEKHEVNATTLEATNYCEIYRRDIEALIMTQPAVGVKLLEELGAKYSRISRLHEILSINDAQGRLAGYLLLRSGESGHSTISLARDDISASINLRTETISRKLNDLQRAGLVELQGHRHIRLKDTPGLRAIFDAAQ